MKSSRHNILSRIKDSDHYFIVNVLSGHADIITSGEYQALEAGGDDIPSDFIEKGYYISKQQEEQTFRLKYIDHLEQLQQEEVQVFFAPTYQCNFKCSYCYQSGYHVPAEKLSEQVIDAFFGFVNTQLHDRRKYITLFGGEPLLPGKQYRESLGHFFSKCHEQGLEMAIVTNGYLLDEYFDLLEQVNIREIQITLDGPQEVHDQRRPHQSGKSTFGRIAANITECLQRGYPVNLRVVLDRDNMNSLPLLAQVAIDQGWTASPLFKTQLGRNYELHYCQSTSQKLYSRLEMYQELYELLQQHPHIMEFHQPAYSVSRFLHQYQELPQPLFDACPACKSEWALDFRGGVYSCTATVGKPGEELGTFYPQLKLNQQAIAQWQNRDVTLIDQCTTCNLQLACGAGCASVAKNNHHTVLAPDCRPIKDLLEMGMNIYFEQSPSSDSVS